MGGWLVLFLIFGLSLGICRSFSLRSKDFWHYLGGVKTLLLFLFMFGLINTVILLSYHSLERSLVFHLLFERLTSNQFLAPARILTSLLLLFSIKQLLPLYVLRDCVSWFIGLVSKPLAGPISLTILIVFAALNQLLGFSRQRTEALKIRRISVRRSPLLWIRLQAIGVLSEAALVSQSLSEGVIIKHTRQQILTPPSYSFPVLSWKERLLQLTVVIGIFPIFISALWVEGMLV